MSWMSLSVLTGLAWGLGVLIIARLGAALTALEPLGVEVGITQADEHVEVLLEFLGVRHHARKIAFAGGHARGVVEGKARRR